MPHCEVELGHLRRFMPLLRYRAVWRRRFQIRPDIFSSSLVLKISCRCPASVRFSCAHHKTLWQKVSEILPSNPASCFPFR